MEKVILHTYFEGWQVDPRASAKRPDWVWNIELNHILKEEYLKVYVLRGTSYDDVQIIYCNPGDWILYSPQLKQHLCLTNKEYRRYCRSIGGPIDVKSTKNSANKEDSRRETSGCFRGN